jgi:Domain of unknown function (DUF4276)
MHLEFLVEDSSGGLLLEVLLPRILGPQDDPHTWRLHTYKGIGRIPKNLTANNNASKRILLDQLPRLLQGYGKTPDVDVVVVVLDLDREDESGFRKDLEQLAQKTAARSKTLFGIAIEEIEAWYFGDQPALFGAFPKAKQAVVSAYIQDSVCGTWERLADAIYPGGSNALKKSTWPAAGVAKHEWVLRIGPLMEVGRNTSPSFLKFRDDLTLQVSQQS